MTLITRDEMRPGQIVARVTTYRVLPTTWAEGSKYAGLHKLAQLLPDRAEWQLVRGRWRVRWRPPFDLLGAHIDGFWIAEEQDRRDEAGDHEWGTFDTWAEAIAYADRRARQA